MTVFRWILGALLAALIVGSVASYAIFLGFDLNHWRERARTLRRGVWMTLLVWFNVEIWGRALVTIMAW
ncbi:MAG: hypothetical protein ABIS28_22180 [Caldimonas sp.]